MNIYEFAMQMERDGEAFYRDLAAKSSSAGVARILNMLAADEVKHYDILKQMAEQSNPEMAQTTILLDAKNQVLGEERLVQGTVDRVAVFPRKVLELALSRRAAAILIAHNHPSGDPTPSRQDRELTSAMKEAARAVEVRFLDHIIMAGDETYSFHQSGG